MSSNSNVETSAGVGAFSFFTWGLSAHFAALKWAELGTVAEWSWWQVFTPALIGLGVSFAVVIISLILIGIASRK